jgi:hypothetical protein
MEGQLQTVVETHLYLSQAKGLLEEEERGAIVDMLAAEPVSGVLIKGSGGIRKIRFGRKGRGKRGGVRVIYFYHDAEMPLYLLTVYAKGRKDDLSRREVEVLAGLTRELVAAERQRRERR